MLHLSMHAEHHCTVYISAGATHGHVWMCAPADTWYTNGSVLVPNTGLEGLISGTFQPVWDAWQRFIEPLVSNVSD